MTSNISWLWPPGFKGESWNPVTGCSHASAGCEHCYAEELSLRYGWTKLPWTAPNAEQNIVCHSERLDIPVRWRDRRCIFVNSMSDLFHEKVPDLFIHAVLRIMTEQDRHIFIVVTKRAERMQRLLAQMFWLRLQKHIWFMVSTEDQKNFDERVPYLLNTPAAVRGISYEPALGPIDISQSGGQVGMGDLRRREWERSTERSARMAAGR
jgi:protein gp37